MRLVLLPAQIPLLVVFQFASYRWCVCDPEISEKKVTYAATVVDSFVSGVRSTMEEDLKANDVQWQ